MPAIKVIFYETQDGYIPILDFLNNLNPKMEAKVAWTINRLEQFGHSLREPYSKSLGDGIFELRAQSGHDISRVLYFFIVNGCVVITHGFIKKTQKTPAQEIERAKKYRDDFLKRNGDL